MIRGKWFLFLIFAVANLPIGEPLYHEHVVQALREGGLEVVGRGARAVWRGGRGEAVPGAGQGSGAPDGDKN